MLPRESVDGPNFIQHLGAAWVRIRAGVLLERHCLVAQPIPYGAMPRLILAWVSTFAIRNRTREIPIGDSAGQFMRLIGLEWTGWDYAALRKQMHALAACGFQFGFGGRTYNCQPIEQFEAWLADEAPERPSMRPRKMILSKPYYDSIVQSTAPLDTSVLEKLHRSSLALDMYC
ncbi:MAG: replication protein RepA [Methylacidiphilaceae bacterium]|nr:replication protein RepA [Candidatus Methylacidiphilaceae bacterium]